MVHRSSLYYKLGVNDNKNNNNNDTNKNNNSSCGNEKE